MRVGARGWDWMDKVICAGPMGSWDFHTPRFPSPPYSLFGRISSVYTFIYLPILILILIISRT